MKIKHIAIATVLHFITLAIFWLLSLGATMGLGFKDELTLFDEIYKFVSLNGMKILSGFNWVLFHYFNELNVVFQWLLILLNSLTQGVLFLFLYGKLSKRKATKQENKCVHFFGGSSHVAIGCVRLCFTF
jgi:hypothetical protein